MNGQTQIELHFFFFSNRKCSNRMNSNRMVNYFSKVKIIK